MHRQRYPRLADRVEHTLCFQAQGDGRRPLFIHPDSARRQLSNKLTGTIKRLFISPWKLSASGTGAQPCALTCVFSLTPFPPPLKAIYAELTVYETLGAPHNWPGTTKDATSSSGPGIFRLSSRIITTADSFENEKEMKLKDEKMSVRPFKNGF